MTRSALKPTDATESVVLLDEEGRPIGTADKRSVHHVDTPLHLAFSCYLFDQDGNVLVTRRALHKHTWPGAGPMRAAGTPGRARASWTLYDGACGRARHRDHGPAAAAARVPLPGGVDGVVENEMCPVFVATATAPVRPDPEEVAEVAWEPWAGFRTGVLDGTRDISPWCRDQVAQLPAEPMTAPEAPYTGLPPAARV